MKRYREILVNTDVASILYRKLLKIRNDEEYALGVMVSLRTDEHRQKMIDILDQGLSNTDDIILCAIDIADGLI
ncbi:MAG: hypothetical protein ACI37R_01005 [Candidatus Avigastranaerophilus sp.]